MFLDLFNQLFSPVVFVLQSQECGLVLTLKKRGRSGGAQAKDSTTAKHDRFNCIQA
jgi:hypothetical protein